MEGRGGRGQEGEEKGEGKGGKISPPRSFLKVGAYACYSVINLHTIISHYFCRYIVLIIDFTSLRN